MKLLNEYSILAAIGLKQLRSERKLPQIVLPEWKQPHLIHHNEELNTGWQLY